MRFKTLPIFTLATYRMGSNFSIRVTPNINLITVGLTIYALPPSKKSSTSLANPSSFQGFYQTPPAWPISKKYSTLAKFMGYTTPMEIIKKWTHSVFPTLHWGWERNFGILRGNGKFSEAGKEFLGGKGIKFFWIRQGWTQNSDTEIILKMILIQK